MTGMGLRVWLTLAASLASLASLEANPAIAASQSRLTCQISSADIQEKAALLQAVLDGDTNAATEYRNLVRRHAREQAECRQGSWPRNRAVWLNLYPCDTQFGQIDQLFDRIANDGYNQIYLATLANGQVLLPGNDNPTPWPSVARTPATASIDLLANAVTAGRARGIEVHAWMFALNYGYAYGQREDRQAALARNGRGQTTLDRSVADTNNADGIFVDPYSPIARQDYQRLLEAVLERDPTGVVLDYVRYPKLSGTDSVADEVRDLWVYGSASRAALLDRAQTTAARSQLETYLDTGRAPTIPTITPDSDTDRDAARDANSATTRNTGSTTTPPRQQTDTPATSLQTELWNLSVAHAAQGIIDFVNLAAAPIQNQRRPVGAAFFPKGNLAIGEGFDSRLQPWDKFPTSIVWHPMLYGGCNGTSCILEDLERVRQFAPPGVTIVPALAGSWGSTSQDRHPPLEDQMEAIAQVAADPRGNINAVSHFSFGWQYPELDQERKFCRL
ncbi:MAG: hypothetical protein EAZ61_06030 [Oscillatoriales cyanobacterium]|nr:MAG: hypothetical protein EAZ61_06030 [Oscillatoriales cyanobacterium]